MNKIKSAVKLMTFLFSFMLCGAFIILTTPITFVFGTIGHFTLKDDCVFLSRLNLNSWYHFIISPVSLAYIFIKWLLSVLAEKH